MNAASPELTLVSQIFNLRAHTSQFGFKHDNVPYILVLGICPGAKLKTIYTTTGVRKQNCARAMKSLIRTGLVRKNENLQYFLTSKSQPCFDYFYPKLKSLSDTYRKKLLKTVNKQPLSAKHITTPQEREQLKIKIAELDSQNLSQTQIARTLGFTKSTINHYIRNYVRKGQPKSNPLHPNYQPITQQQPSFPAI